MKDSVYYYCCVNIFLTLIYGLNLFFKLSKGFKKWIYRFKFIGPALVMIAVLWIVRNRFTYGARVCLCDYKEDFFKIRSIDPSFFDDDAIAKDITPENYDCLPELATTMRYIFISSFIFDGIFFLVIFITYYSTLVNSKEYEQIVERAKSNVNANPI